MATWKKLVIATGSSAQYIKGDGTLGTYSTTDSSKLPLTGGTISGSLNIFASGGDANLRLRSGATRSGLFIDKPATTTTMGSALVLADSTFRLGTATYYHMEMTQAGNTILKGGGNTALTIDSSQRVGIGTASLSRKFTVVNTTTNTATGYFYTNAVHTGVDTHSVVSIRSDNASSNGNVLHVQGDGTGNLLTLSKDGSDNASSNGNVLHVQGDGTGNLLTLSKDGSDKLTVTHEGNVTIQNPNTAGIIDSLTLINPRNSGSTGDGTQINFQNTTTSARSAFIKGMSTGTYGQSNVLVFGTSSGVNAPTEKMRLTSTGLGIGTNAPASSVQIAGVTGQDGLRVYNRDGGIGVLVNQYGTLLTYNGYLGTSSSSIPFYFQTGGTTRLTLSHTTATFAGDITVPANKKITIGGQIGIGALNVKMADGSNQKRTINIVNADDQGWAFGTVTESNRVNFVLSKEYGDNSWSDALKVYNADGKFEFLGSGGATFAGDVVLNGATKGIDFSGSGKHIISGSGSGSYIEINNVGQITPNGNNSFSLGTSSNRWSNTHTQLLNVGGQTVMTGTLKLSNTSTAPTNGESLPPALEFIGRGWDSNSGSDLIMGKIHLGGDYGEYGSGATQAWLGFSVQGSGGLGSEPETLIEGLRVLADGGVVANKKFNVGTHNSNSHRLVIESMHATVPYAPIVAGSADNNQAVGFQFVTRNSNGDENNKMYLTSTGLAIGTIPTHNLNVYNGSGVSSMTVGKYASGKTVGVIGTSADTSGYFQIQSYASQGSSFGNIVLNAQGGNIGIGVASPASSIHAKSSASTLGTLERSTSGNVLLEWKNTGDSWYAGIDSSQNFKISQNGDIASGTEFKLEDETGNATFGGDLIVDAKQIRGGFGAETTSGTADWNHVTNARSGNGYTLLLGSATNGPTGNTYYHTLGFEYGVKNGGGNLTQIGIPYTGAGIVYRSRYSGSWSAYKKVLDNETYSDYAVPKTGGTFTGGVTIASGGSTDNLYLANTSYGLKITNSTGVIDFVSNNSTRMSIANGGGVSFVSNATFFSSATIRSVVTTGDKILIGHSGVTSTGSYNKMELEYTGYNSGNPRLYITPDTNPGSGVLYSYVHIRSKTGGSGANKMGLIVDGQQVIGNTTPYYNLDIVSEGVATGLRLHRKNSSNNTTTPIGIGFSHRGDGANSSGSDTRAGIYSHYNGEIYIANRAATSIGTSPYQYRTLLINGSGTSTFINSAGTTVELATSSNGAYAIRSASPAKFNDYYFNGTSGSIKKNTGDNFLSFASDLSATFAGNINAQDISAYNKITIESADISSGEDNGLLLRNTSGGSNQDWHLTAGTTGVSNSYFTIRDGTTNTNALIIKHSSNNARFNGSVAVPSNHSFNAENTSGTEKAILTFDSSNRTKVGDNSNSGVLILDSGDATFAGDLDASAGQSLTGWHTQDKIWVMPSDFIENDDSSNRNIGLVDNGGELRVMYADLEAYVNIPIPSGYKVTHFRLNGTASVGINASYSDCTTATATSCQPPTSIYTNTEVATNPSSGIEANDSTGRYIILKWSATHVSHRLYGGYVKIAKI